MKREIGSEPARVEPLLNTSERLSPLWAKLARHLDSRLQTLRSQNDGDQPEAKTAILRGRIAEIKAFLEHGKDPVQPE